MCAIVGSISVHVWWSSGGNWTAMEDQEQYDPHNIFSSEKQIDVALAQQILSKSSAEGFKLQRQYHEVNAIWADSERRSIITIPKTSRGHGQTEGNEFTPSQRLTKSEIPRCAEAPSYL